ncbi:MAG: hypothetical protein PHC41_11245 [Lachnospiraceae bacterium]|jgi:hypothetical protein|nr:hypothetical protein [Lachnospiraceae bacterium]MDD3616782.1 hypothetical protein [Lachnospiraceae bacterium]
MSIEQRIRMCLLIEKMKANKDYSEKLGIEDISRFRGKRMKGGEKTC